MGPATLLPSFTDTTIDSVENEAHDIAVVGRPRGVLARRRGVRRRVVVVAGVMRVRMAIPTTVPLVLAGFVIVGPEIVGAIPSDIERCVLGRHRDVARVENREKPDVSLAEDDLGTRERSTRS